MIRWAILGTGMVAHKFVSDLRHATPRMAAVAVASRGYANAQALAAQHEGVQAYESFEAAVQAPDVDAVYIATPPSVHEEQALMALAAGKAVLIEKPFATDGASAARIADAARAAGVFCMEAMWTRFLPLLDVVRGKLKTNDIGELRSLSGSFGISSFPDPNDSLFDPSRGGGALLHRGIYPLSLAHHLMGPVVDMSVSGRLGESGVDEDISLILRHDTGGLSTISASLRAPSPNDLTIGGTNGMMRLVKPVYRPFVLETARAAPRKSGAKAGRLGALRESDLGQKLNQRLPDALRNRLEKTTRQRAPYVGQGYHYQASEVARCLGAGQGESSVMPLSESVAIMELVDAAYKKLKQDS